MKGKVDPVGAYRVLREKPVGTRFQAAAERGLSPLVGRDPELAQLARHVEQARTGRGQVVYLLGEAGIGKSRLILELRRRLDGEGVKWLEGHCVSYGRKSPYLPFVDLLKGVFGIKDADDDARIIGRVDEVTSQWQPSARQRVPYLRYLLSVDPGDERVTMMDAQERRIEIFEALSALILEESRRQPLVVIVEDLHWADQMSQEALAALLGVVGSAPVLLLLTQRPVYDRPLDDFQLLKLEPLDEEQSVTLTRGVLGVEMLPPEVQRLITAKAEGNPFYIEEVSKALVETGIVARANGSYHLQRPLEQVDVPGTIQEVILSRIDRLEREAKQAIQLAAVIGREFTARLLERILALEEKLSEILGELEAIELIYEKEYLPELAYMFKHALTQDVAYATLLAERRRALHRLVGAAIEELYGDRLAEHYERLAHHYVEVTTERRLSAISRRPARALGYADECLALAEYSTSRKYIVMGRRLRAEALLAQGRLDEAEQELFVALEAAVGVGNPPQLWRTYAAVGDLRRSQGRVKEALHSYGAALSFIEAVGESISDAQLQSTFLQSEHVQGIRRKAEGTSS